KNVILYLVLIVAIVALYGFAFTLAADDGSEGKKVFVDKKCVMCHSMEAEGIESTKKSGAVDLSEIDKSIDADFMTKYLMKESKPNDADHKTKFKGTDEKLKALVDYLLTLKAE